MMQNNLLQVLLVEPIETDAQFLRGLIENSDLHKIRVQHVSSLSSATKHLASNQADVVLLDLNLPECHGIESLRRFLTAWPRVPVVVITRAADEIMGLEAIGAGAQDFVSERFISADMIVRRLLFAQVRHTKLLGLKDAANFDHLTTLANRRRFEEAFNEMRFREVQSERVLALLDVDHFKQLNDLHGHVGGDRALRHLAKLLASELENEHQVFRYGGEEFAILSEQTLERAEQRLDDLLKRIAAEEFNVESKALQITASVGVTSITSEDTCEHAILRCDKALYSAKALGRNCVVVAGRSADRSTLLEC